MIERKIPMIFPARHPISLQNKNNEESLAPAKLPGNRKHILGPQ
jgi:hypothetical protein